MDGKRESETSRNERFFRLFMSSQSRIYAYILMLVHNHNDAEDLLQETASVLWERFDEYVPEKSFAAWAVGIARNKVFNFIRDNSRTRVQFQESIINKIAEYGKHSVDEEPERVEAIKRCVEKLKADDRRLILVRYEHNITIKKLAELIGRSPAGLYKTMGRIHHMLLQCVRRVLASWETA